jgi:outer membrane lipoprotein SlyB
MKKSVICLLAFAVLAGAGCASSVRPLEVQKNETGVISRVEAATIVSITNVTIKGERTTRGLFQRRGNRARAVTLVVRVERNGETLSVSQGDDVGMSVNQQVWLQFGDRVRVIPR